MLPRPAPILTFRVFQEMRLLANANGGISILLGHARDVAAWSAEAGDEAEPDRIPWGTSGEGMRNARTAS